MLTASLSGCLHDRPARSSSFLDRLGVAGPSGPDAVSLEYAVIERPAGSPAINRDVWATIDELVLSSDTRALLSENGFRAGVVGGLLPSELETMLANPRSATGHRERRLYVGSPAQFAINGPVPQADFQVRPNLDKDAEPAHFEQARFSISVTPRYAADGRIILRCVPEVEYDDKKHWLPTGAAGLGWGGSKPVEKYAALAWEITLSPREFLVIGTHHERGQWLGNQTFTGTRGKENVQRLLVIRAARVAPVIEPLPGETAKGGVAPIASQASVSIARGIGQ
jgi:hypothetical protein